MKELDDYQMFTRNYETGDLGVASFCSDGKSVLVFEGAGDGSDDKKMDFEAFVNGYDFGMALDTEEIPLIHNI